MKKIMVFLLAVLAVGSVFGQGVAENQKVIQALYPQDLNGLQTNMIAVSLKNYGRATFVLQTGVINASMTALTCTVQQCTAVAGTGAKTLAISNYYENGISGDIYTNTATTVSGSIVLDNADDLKTFMFDIPASALDVQNGFDCLWVVTSTASAHSQIYNAFWILSEPRYTGDKTAQPSAIVD